jgi:phosphatidylserine decarboxylase
MLRLSYALQHALTKNIRLAPSSTHNLILSMQNRKLTTTPENQGRSGRYNQAKLGIFGKAIFKPFPARGFQYKGQGIKRTWQQTPSDYTQKTGKRFSATNDYKEVQKEIFDSRGRFARILFNRLIKNQQLGEKIPIIRLYPDTVNVFYFSFWAAILYVVYLYLKDEMGTDYDFRTNRKRDANWREYINFVRDETRESLFSNCYTRLPLRYVSRLWGKFNAIEFPDYIRVPLMKGFIGFFGVNMSEAYVENLEKYKSINSLFRRRLKPGAREIDENCSFVAPCDGKVLSFGKLDDDTRFIEQVKGVDYSLKALLGPNKNDKNGNIISLKNMDEKDYRESWMKDPEKNDLYYAVIYLAPKDYHRFHSPVDWEVEERRHFPGKFNFLPPFKKNIL